MLSNEPVTASLNTTPCLLLLLLAERLPPPGIDLGELWSDAESNGLEALRPPPMAPPDPSCMLDSSSVGSGVTDRIVLCFIVDRKLEKRLPADALFSSFMPGVVAVSVVVGGEIVGAAGDLAGRGGGSSSLWGEGASISGGSMLLSPCRIPIRHDAHRSHQGKGLYEDDGAPQWMHVGRQ